MSGEENSRCIPHPTLKDSWSCHVLKKLIVSHEFSCVTTCAAKLLGGACFLFWGQHEHSEVLSTVVSSV